MKKEKKDNNNKIFNKGFTIFFVIIAILAVGSLVFTVPGAVKKYDEYKIAVQAVEKAEKEKDASENERREIEDKVEKGDIASVMEYEARKLGYIYEDENVYIISPAG